MIEIERVSKDFGRKREIHALDRVTFVAGDGAITGLLGPNGAGKTTLLRILATLVVPDSGSARIGGLDVVRDRFAVRRRIGVLSDARGIYARLSARENIRYYGQLHGLARDMLGRRVESLIALLGLEAIADRPASGLSQGERMKVAIGRALVHDPGTLMLDEPTNGLDIMSVRNLRDLLRDIRARGTCILYSSHVMQEVSALCDRIVVLAHGRVVAEGTPEFLLRASGQRSLEDALVSLLGSGEGLAA